MSTITVPTGVPGLEWLTDRGCTLFASGDHCECKMPVGWSAGNDGVIVDEDGCVVAVVRLSRGGFIPAIDTTHAGKWYGSAKLHHVRELIAASKLPGAYYPEYEIEISNRLQGETGMVADELRSLFAC